MIFLYRFSESITIAIVKFLLAATCCSLLQQPSLSPAPHLSNSPSPKSRRPGGRGRRGPRWLPQQPGLHSYILLHTGTKLTVVLHRAADRSGSNRILEVDWL